jgi:regulator of RNase E activity RraA
MFARSVNPRGPIGAAKGAVNAPVKVGGRLINPGDLIIGDDDGLVALSAATVRTRLADAEAKLALEETWVDALTDGRSVARTFDLKPAKPAD